MNMNICIQFSSAFIDYDVSNSETSTSFYNIATHVVFFINEKIKLLARYPQLM